MKNSWKTECRYPDMITGKSKTAIIDFGAFGNGNDEMTGRPQLLDRIWPAVVILFANINPQTASQTKHLLRRFWNFLDYMDALKAMSFPGSPGIVDLDWDELELLWRHWVDWLRTSKYSEHHVARVFWFVKKVFDTAFELASESGKTSKQTLELFGYFKIPMDIKVAETLTVDDARRMFKAIRNSWFESVKRVTTFNELAAQGRPHVRSTKGSAFREARNYWASLSNRLWIFKEYFPWTYGWNSKCPVKDIPDHLEDYEPPQWSPITPFAKKGRNLSAHLGAVFFTFDDLALAISLIAMKTPLNSSTIGSFRVSHWFIRDPQHPDRRVVIFARKARAKGGLQKAYSSIKSLSDPYEVIKTVIERTEPLRQAARSAAAELRNKTDRSADEDKELERLNRLSDAVWLCPSTKKGIIDIGETLGQQSNSLIHRVLDRVLLNIKANDGKQLRFRLSEGRDIWALYVYERSGHSLLLTQFALSHSGLSSLVRYLNSRVLRVKNFLKVAKLQERVFTELANRRYDPMILRQLVGDGRMTSDEADKLVRSVRSSFGLRCTDPKNPDARADPGHSAGTLCRAQLCPFCTKWYATGESVPFLQRALLDLADIESSTGMIIWETSSYPLWRALFQGIVGRFHKDIQSEALEKAKHMPPILTARRFVGFR